MFSGWELTQNHDLHLHETIFYFRFTQKYSSTQYLHVIVMSLFQYKIMLVILPGLS